MNQRALHHTHEAPGAVETRTAGTQASTGATVRLTMAQALVRFTARLRRAFRPGQFLPPLAQSLPFPTE